MTLSLDIIYKSHLTNLNKEAATKCGNSHLEIFCNRRPFNLTRNWQRNLSNFITCSKVHGKTTDEWDTNDIRVHTCDIRMTYEYIRVTYEWHTSTYEWHTNDIRVHTSNIRMTYEYIRVTYGWDTSTYEWHTSTYEWHMDDIRVHTSDMRMTYEYIRVTYRWHTSTYEWHTDDIWVTCRLLQLNLGAQGEHLTSQLSWAVTWLLVTGACPVYLVG